MKRIRYACVEQTIHFQLKDDLPHDIAVAAVQNEYAQYLAHLDRTGTAHRILSETTEPDGSIVVMIKKQLNSYPVGSYLD